MARVPAKKVATMAGKARRSSLRHRIGGVPRQARSGGSPSRPAELGLRALFKTFCDQREEALAAGAGPEPVVCAAGANNLLAEAWASRKQGLYMLCSCRPRRKIMCGVRP